MVVRIPLYDARDVFTGEYVEYQAPPPKVICMDNKDYVLIDTNGLFYQEVPF